jgi:hypothetical protein
MNTHLLLTEDLQYSPTYTGLKMCYVYFRLLKDIGNSYIVLGGVAQIRVYLVRISAILSEVIIVPHGGTRPCYSYQLFHIDVSAFRFIYLYTTGCMYVCM